MTIVKSNGLDIKVEEHGPKDGPPILLISGWSVQLTFWPKPFIDRFVDAGYRVITFDNRDVGLSQKFRYRPVSYPFAPHVIASRLLKRKVLVAYTLEDMAADAVGVLDALGLPRAHIVGLSMGGMITQIIAARYANRVRSASILMSSSNRAGLPTPPPDIAFSLIFGRRGRDPRKRSERTQRIWRRIRTQDGGYDDSLFADAVNSTIERSYYPAGRRRQMEAIMATGDLRRFARRINAPTLVIHGSADKLARPHGGLDIAANIAGARFELIEGMGHDLPPNRLDMISDMIIDHATKADNPKQKVRRVA